MDKNSVLETLASYKDKNTVKYGIEKMGLFGSVARDEMRSDSDVDICIETKEADMFVLVHIKDELQSLLSRSIDIVRIRDKMNPFLKKRIEKEAIYV